MTPTSETCPLTSVNWKSISWIVEGEQVAPLFVKVVVIVEQSLSKSQQIMFKSLVPDSTLLIDFE